MASALRSQVSSLMEKLKALEAEIETRSARLHAPGQPGLKGSLTDAQGFPRGDIDVPAVRADRHHIICLTNDHKQLMGQIQELMLQLHAAERESRAAASPAGGTASHTHNTAASSEPTEAHEDKRQKLEKLSITQDTVADAGAQQDAATAAAAAAAAASAGGGAAAAAAAAPAAPAPAHTTIPELQPFAVIDELTEGSPAATAGLRLGDLMCRFGGVTASSAGGVLQQVAAELASHEGQHVEAVLLRQGQQVVVQFVPQRWAGRGLLGCHLHPLQLA